MMMMVIMSSLSCPSTHSCMPGHSPIFFVLSCSYFVYAASLLKSCVIVHVDMQAHKMWGCRQEQTPLKAWRREMEAVEKRSNFEKIPG